MVKYQNTQQHSECNLVSIWNAARFYGMENQIPKLGTPEYEQACVDYHCISGSCLGIKKELKRLGLKKVEGKWDYDWISKKIVNNIPVELSISHKKYGTHSILVVDIFAGRFLVTNYTKNRTQWLYEDELFKLKINNPYFLPQAIKKKWKFWKRW